MRTDSIKNSLALLKAGVQPKKSYALKPWQRKMWTITLWTWRTLLITSIFLLIYNLF